MYALSKILEDGMPIIWRIFFFAGGGGVLFLGFFFFANTDVRSITVQSLVFTTKLFKNFLIAIEKLFDPYFIPD